MYIETKTRSIIKSVSWRILATLTTIVLVYIFIGDTKIALSVGGIEVFLKMLIYFLHERGWEKIRFGRREVNPAVIWFTGLAKSGKKAIALELQTLLRKKGFKTEFIDGHSIRELFPQTGFEREAVNLHIERVGYLARKLEDQGVFVIASFLSPYRESRDIVRSLTNNFNEIWVSTPVEVCERRDETGIFEKARRGEVEHFPGVTGDYEEPDNPEFIFNIAETDPKSAAKKIYNDILKRI